MFQVRALFLFGLTAYGGVFVATALIWRWLGDGVRPDR